MIGFLFGLMLGSSSRSSCNCNKNVKMKQVKREYKYTWTSFIIIIIIYIIFWFLITNLMWNAFDKIAELNYVSDTLQFLVNIVPVIAIIAGIVTLIDLIVYYLNIGKTKTWYEWVEQ